MSLYFFFGRCTKNSRYIDVTNNHHVLFMTSLFCYHMSLDQASCWASMNCILLGFFDVLLGWDDTETIFYNSNLHCSIWVFINFQSLYKLITWIQLCFVYAKSNNRIIILFYSIIFFLKSYSYIWQIKMQLILLTKQWK